MPLHRRTDAGLEPSHLFLELIDPFLERSQGQFADVLARHGASLDRGVKLFQFLKFLASVFQLVPVFNAHGETSTIPLGTKFRSVAKVFSVNCSKAAVSTSSRLMNGKPARSSISAA